MSPMQILRPLVAGITLFSLAACSSDPNQPKLGDRLKTFQKALSTRKAEPVTVTPEMMQQALGSTTQPVIIASLDKTGAQALMVQIERNGRHATFATSTRQSIILRDGLITGTRGFGGDLMSSDESNLLSALRNGGGSASYTMRFLTPEDVTKDITTTCTLTPVQRVSVETGSGQAINATCESNGVSFKNTFIVGDHGQVLTSRQWLGETLGFVNVSYLRR